MNTRLLERIALGAALLALVVIGIRPSITRPVDAGVAVVRTPGATLADARAVAESLGGTQVIDLEAGERPRHEGRLHLVGWGFDANELRRFGDRELILHFRPLPTGVRQVSWPGALSLGTTMELQVEVVGPRGIAIVLEGEDGAVDSVVSTLRGRFAATLRHTPRAVGSARYRLRFGAATDTFSVLVVPAALPTALILASAPSREWSDLRDWIARQGGTVTVRTTVGRDRVRLERINTRPASQSPLTSGALASTGVVITDSRTLATLTRAERAQLTAAVTEGLGLIVVLGEQAGRSADPLTPWRSTAVADLEERQVRPRLDGRGISPTPVPAKGVVIAAGPFGSRALLDDGQGGVLAMSGTSGRGRIVGTVVDGAGRWLRGGEDGAFATYWHALVDAAARDDRAAEGWELPSHPVLIDEETRLGRRGLRGDAWVVAGDTLASAADPVTPEWRRARWWPRHAGWNDVEGARLFVGGPAAWSTWRAAERTRLTASAIARRRGEAVPGDRVPVRIPWPLLPFYILFVAAAGVLWRRRSV